MADRIAQTVVAKHLEERVEPVFHPDSYGYRPGRSAASSPRPTAAAPVSEPATRASASFGVSARVDVDPLEHEQLVVCRGVSHSVTRSLVPDESPGV